MVVFEQRQLPNLFTILPLPLPEPSLPAGLTNSGSVTQSVPASSATSVTSLTQASQTAPVVSESSLATTSSTDSVSSSESLPLTPTPTPSDFSIQTTTSADGSTYYVTLYTTPSPEPSIQAAPSSSSKGFLQNKALSGTILAIVGVAGLALLIAIATIAIRRSRRQRLHAEAVSFDPSPMGGDATEKRRFSLLSSDNGHSIDNSAMGGNLGRGHPGMNPASAPLARPHQDPYRFPASESQHTLIGNVQPPWSGDVGTARVPRTDPRPAWGYGS